MISVLRSVAGLVAFAVVDAAALASQSPAPPAADSVRRALADYAQQAEALGASGVLLVADGDDILLHRALGWRDRTHRVPNDTTTLFYIASMEKQFIATAVLVLEDEGRLRTNDTLPSFFENVPPDKRAITLDQLLSHTSGLGFYGWDPVRRDWLIQDRDQVVHGILESRLAHQPGSQFDYQNVNYLLLAAVVERVSGLTWESFVQQRFLQPLAMRNTFVGWDPRALRERMAWSIDDESESFTMADRPASWLRLGRGVVMTASDLYRWIRAVGKGGVLSAASRRKLFTIHASLGPGYGYGLGWFVRADSSGAPRVVFHGGDYGAYHGEMRLYPPSGRIMIALTNVGYRGRSITETLLNGAVTVFHGSPSPLPLLARGGEIADDSLAGEYQSATGGTMLVSAIGGSLVVTPVSQRAVDWLTRGDTAGSSARELAGSNALRLVEGLKAGRVDLDIGGTVPAELRRELDAEWSGLTRVGGRLKSVQLLGTMAGPEGDEQLSLLRLKFERDSLLYGVGWKDGALAYTQPGTRNVIGTTVFAAAAGGDWVAYNWTADALAPVTFSRGHPVGRAPSLVFRSTDGDVVFTRRPSGENHER
jgi:CubicO group peptidase (beta-lactamase class C family)